LNAPKDFTDLTRAEQIRLLYASIVESSHDAIISKDLDGVISAWNPAAERVFGYTEQEVIGRPSTMLIPPDLHDEEQELLRRLRLGERVENHETVWLNKAGEAVHLSVTMSPLRDPTGAIIGCAKIARDLTQARQTEAALRQSELERTLAQNALRESEARFRLIANSAPVMIWMSGDDKEITYLNQTWLDFTGRSLEEALGHRWAEVLHPDELERCRDVYVSAFEQRLPFHVDHRMRRRDGEYRWAETVGVPRYDVDGSFAGYIGTAVDITERKLAEEALSTVSQRLIEAHEQEGVRIARELHDDINQRLAFLNLRLGYLKQSSEGSSTEFDREIAAISQHITELVSDIQALSHGLHSSRLELLGLEAAATGFCEELSNRHGVTIGAGARPRDLPLSLPRAAGSAAEYREAQLVTGRACLASC
jgi:PAS domain S-box-containing protein